MENRSIPTYLDLLWPTLKALKSLGGSASIQEVSVEIATDLELNEEILNHPHKKERRTEIDYRAAWARTNLKYVGAIENIGRGKWRITDAGRGIRSQAELHRLLLERRKRTESGEYVQ